MKKFLAILCAIALAGIVLTIYAPTSKAQQAGRYDSWAVDSQNHFVASPVIDVYKWADPWSSTTAYSAGTVVTYNGSFYVAAATSTNVVPGTSPTNWTATTGTHASIYSDRKLATSQNNPFNGDTLGNYGFWALPGDYLVSVNGFLMPVSINAGTTTLDATKFLTGSGDVCSAINGAWSYAVSKGYKSATVDARGFHGTQTCSSWMFATYPYVKGNACSFGGKLLLGDIELRTDVSQIIPCNGTLEGTARNGVGQGTTIRASNAFYTQVPAAPAVVQMGTDNWTGVVGGTPPEGVWIEQLIIQGRPPSGTYTPTTCVLNQFAQENSGGRFLHMDGCLTALERQVDPTSAIFGALDDGPWENIHVNFNGITAADAPNALCIKSGTARSGLGSTRGIRYVSCNIAGLTVQPNEAVRFSGTGFVLQHAHFEGFKDTIVPGEDFITTGFIVDDISTVSFAGTFQGQNVFRVPASGHFVTGHIEGILAGGVTAGMNAFKDDNDGFTVAPNIFLTDFAYPRAAIPSISVHSASYPMTLADSGSIHGFNGFGSTATVTLPATVPAGWNVRIINYNPSGSLVVDPNGHFMNGSTGTVTMPAGQSSTYITTNGTNFYASFGALPSTTTFPALSDLSNPLASKTFTMGGFGLTLQGSASQTLSPLSILGSGSNSSNVTLLNVQASGTGTNEKDFSFTNIKSNFTHSTAAGDLQFSNLGVATAGTHLNSFMYQTTAKCFNGTASTADSGGWQIQYEGTSNTPLSNYKAVFSGGCSGVRMIDLTGAAGVRALSIRSNTSANTDLVGELAFSAATTASYTFAGSYGSHPECTVEPQFDIGSGNRHWITYTGATSMTINFATAVTGNVGYKCHGRN